MPVASHDAVAAVALPHQRVAGFQLSDILERGRRSGDVPDVQKRVERLPVERTRRQASRMQRLELGCERDAPGGREHVQRLDAEAVTAEQQRALGRVPYGEREHAAELLDARRSELLVQVEYGLRIALRTEHVAAGDEAAA